MSLKDNLLNQSDTSTNRSAKGSCSVREWLSKQNEQMVAEFKEVLATDTSTMALHRFLCSQNIGIDFGLTAFRSHRNQWCSCL
jgi:hypothetical protein